MSAIHLAPTPLVAEETRTSESEWPAPSAPSGEAALVAARPHDPERYQILGEHGRGGLGRVSRAHDRELGRDVAIKELISRGPMSEIRFLREALITARLEHPGIVPIHEAGRWPDGTPFYAMKLVAGRPLLELLAERAAVDERIALLHHVIAVADAIAYAHGKNIIHRDLKPANVIVGDFGETVVIDWGLAKDLTVAEDSAPAGDARGSHNDGLTSAGVVMGTPGYMAPEQRRGDRVDQRADVFAIGAMLWELCFRDEEAPAEAHERRDLLRHAGIDPDLATIIDKALDADAERRYPHAGALAADLKAFKAGARIAARRYSLWAMLVHWTRRHRALAISAAALVALAVTGGALYVRNIAAERDRADQERVRARLSEASALLEKDPARARDVLASLDVRSPRYALLTSRATQRAATSVITGLTGVAGLFAAQGTPEVALLTRDGELYRVDPRTGQRQLIDHEVVGTVAFRDGEWLYARKPFNVRSAILSTPSRVGALEAGGLAGVRHLVSLHDAVYAVDTANDLYRVSHQAPVRVRRGIHRIAGDGHLLLACALDGTLEVFRDGEVVRRAQCPKIVSPERLAVVGDDYATVTAPGVLSVVRGGRADDIAVELTGEHEVALSRTGVVAIADYEHRTAWFVRPGSTTLEPAPAHASSLMCTAAGAQLAAWGYSDGTVIALDTATGNVWQLQGHPDPASHIAIDDAGAMVVTTSSQDLRVWNLRPPPITRVSPVHCETYNLVPSPDGTRVAMDCNAGSVWLWSRDAGTVTRLHQHEGHAFGVQWLGDQVCSSGWDGKVMCSSIDGQTQRVFDPGGGKIQWLAASPRSDFLVLATVDGRVWKLDDALHPLYSQDAVPYRLAVDAGGTRVASCGLDGSLVVFDLARGRLVWRLMAHAGAARSIAWWGEAIWTAGIDGKLREWVLRDGELQMRSEVRQPHPFRMAKIFAGGWVASIDEGVLWIQRTGAPPLRLELDQHIPAIDVSPDGRYVLASVPGEIVVVDLGDDKLATVPIDSNLTSHAAFVDARSVAFTAHTGLKMVRVDQLAYVAF